MSKKPTYDELAQKVVQLEEECRSIKQSRDEFTRMFELIPDLLCIAGVDGFFKRLNPAWEKVLGYTNEELLAKPLFDFIHPDDQQATLAEIERQNAGQATLSFKNRYQHKDGSYRLFSWKATPAVGDMLFGVARDITEEEQADKQQNLLQQRLESLWKISSMLDADFRSICDMILDEITKMTGSQYGFFGFLSDDESEMRVISWSEEVMEGCLTKDKTLIFSIEKSGIWGNAVRERKPFIQNDYNLECQNKKGLPEGHVSLTRVMSIPVMLSGKIVAVGAVANKKDDYTDNDINQLRSFLTNALIITERKLAEQEIKESAERYRELVEGTDNLVTQVDAEGIFTYINAIGEKVLGKNVEELIGTSAFLYVHPDDQQRCKEWFSDCVKRKLTQSTIENRQVNQTTGDIFHMLWTCNFIYDHKENLASINGIAHDISYKKRLEEENVRTKKLEATAILAGGIAHDFNNLLSVVRGNIDMALEEVNPANPANKFLRNALTASKQGRNLTTKFLTFSQGGAPVREKISIEKLLTDASHRILSDSGVLDEFSIPADLWNAYADPNQILQVFSNVIQNAKEAMSQGGTLRITAKNFDAGKVKGDSPVRAFKRRFVKISFQDNGGGIRDENFPLIFDPYFSTKEMGPQKGMGLGLTIANSIVDKHGGYIDVVSEYGKGATVDIFLPASEKTLETTILTPSKAKKISRKILFMEDEMLMQKMVTDMAARLGHEVIIASCGEEAIKFYSAAREEGAPFDVVFLDLLIKSGMGGREVINELLAIDPEIKAIVTSGYSNTENPVLANYEEYGFKAVLLKPFLKKDFQEIMEEVLTV